MLAYCNCSVVSIMQIGLPLKHIGFKSIQIEPDAFSKYYILLGEVIYILNGQVIYNTWASNIMLCEARSSARCAMLSFEC